MQKCLTAEWINIKTRPLTANEAFQVAQKQCFSPIHRKKLGHLQPRFLNT